nr:hypothetical protein [Tanacetum cinerariifolium]
LRKKSVKKLVERRVAKAIEEYEKTRADSVNAGGSRSASTGGSADVQGCSYKIFMNCKPHSFNRTKGVVGLKQYCPATEIQKIEQELWTLTLKGDDIEAYNNHFHELALMCPELVPTEKKMIEKYVRSFLKESKEISLLQSRQLYMMPSTWLVNWLSKQFRVGLSELVKEIKESGKTTKETPTTITPTTNLNNNNNNRNRNNNHHQQQNRRQETARAYVAAPAKGRGYARNLPRCNHFNSHHNGQCPPNCPKCQRTGHQEKDCRVRALQDMTCYGCGEKGNFKDKLVENPQQNPNVVTGSFDVITGMDCLSYHRAIIDCYEKIVCIPLSNGKILEVQGERPKKDSGSLVCIKADEKKLDDIRVVQ